MDAYFESKNSGGSFRTEADGLYTVKGLAAGDDYTVCFKYDGSEGTGYVDQCYYDQPTPGTPTPVEVTLGGITHINAALVEAP